MVVSLEGEQEESESVGERGLSSKKRVPWSTALGTVVDEQE